MADTNKLSNQKIANYIVDAYFMEPIEEEFKLVGLTRINVSKRKKFSLLYRTTILYLTILSLPETHPEHYSDIRREIGVTLGSLDNKKESNLILEYLKKYEKLTLNDEDRMFKIAQYIIENTENKSIKNNPLLALHTAFLKRRLEELYVLLFDKGKEIH